ncbi:MAG: hypothetical protein LBS20_05065 [Prevotella sp.]|jgi:hypothetical protein|nr:hypothetical protein [Prevotella sp.]
MKLKHLLFVAISLFLLFQSCSDDDTKINPENKIPETIQKDINSRFTKAEIKYYSIDDNDLIYVSLIYANNNSAELIYKNNELDSEYRTITDLKDLPQVVQTAFNSLSIQGISDLKIYKTQRSYLKHDLYTFCFLQTTNKVTNLVYSIFINEDGIVLYTINNTTNDNVMLFPNYLTEFNYIEKNYKQADVRCQLNTGGYYILIIKHDGYTKFVSFDKNNNTNVVFWKETRYEVPLDYPIPANILVKLKDADPNFIYTSVTIIETSEGNRYSFVDKSKENQPGYIIGQ